MKVSIEDENNFIVFLNNKKFNFEDKEKLEDYFKEIFNEIKKRYNFDVSGYYDIVVYNNELFGMILTMKKEEFEYYDYFDNQVEMKIVISPYNEFIYKLENNDLNINLKNSDIYLHNGNIYILPNKDIKNIEFGYILEYTTVIYGHKAEEIIKNAKKR